MEQYSHLATQTDHFLRVFEEADLREDFPVIEAPSSTIVVDNSFSKSKFDDLFGYATVWSEKGLWRKCCQKELVFAQDMVAFLAKGRVLMNSMYTYRSISKALSHVKATNDDEKVKMFEKQMEVLKPELQKLRDLMTFTDELGQYLVKMLGTVGRRLTEKDTPNLWSESFLWDLLRLLDIAVVLDTIKNMKGCIVNDFAMYKRVSQYFDSETMGMDEHMKISQFLQPYSMLQQIKKAISEVKHREEALAVLANMCAEWLEDEKAVLPAETFTLLRTLAFLVYLLSEQDHDIIKNKLVKHQRFCALVKKYPVVPVYGDMQCTLLHVIKLSPHFEEKLWQRNLEDVKGQAEYNLLASIDSMRAQQQALLLRLSTVLEALKRKSSIVPTNGEREDWPLEEFRPLIGVLRSTVLLASSWSQLLLFQAALKYSTPATNVPAETAEYERAVQRNYTAEECYGLVEGVAAMKTLAGIMSQHEHFIMPFLHRCIHDDIQHIVQGPLRDMIRQAAKKQRTIRFDLFDFRLLGADWVGGVEPNDPILFGQKPGKLDSQISAKRTRAAPPAHTQWRILRAIVYGLIAHKFGGKKNLYADKDLGSSKNVAAMEAFYKRSKIYEYLLNLSTTVDNVVNTSDLWYREFYLALSDRTQFPIEMSMPWILTKRILEKPVLAEYVLTPLDIYNDAAMTALRVLRKRYLYDEIEAELNLAFDQFLFMLSDSAFLYFKTQAARQLMDNRYATMWREYAREKQRLQEERAGENKSRGFLFKKRTRLNDDIDIPITRIEAALQQRHFQLLGRSIDISFLCTQRVNVMIQKNMEFIIAKFEASDITSIVELETMCDALRATHALARQSLPDLDAYEDLWAETNQAMSAASLHGRVVLHAIMEVVVDVVPNYVYSGVTHRFTRAPISLAEDVKRRGKPQQNFKYMFGSRGLTGAYSTLLAPYCKFIGQPHIQSLVRVVGPAGVKLIASELLNNAALILLYSIYPYLEELRGALPKDFVFPKGNIGAHGTFVQWELALASIIGYADLKTSVYQHMREFGNTIIFLHEIDLALRQLSMQVRHLSSAFLDIGLSQPDKGGLAGGMGDDPPLLAGFKSIFQAGGALKIPDYLDFGTNIAYKADALYRKVRGKPTVFQDAVHGLAQSIRMEMMDDEGPGDVKQALNLEDSAEFYKVWSSVLFVGCLPTSATELSNMELFGEGYLWAGEMILHALDQTNRFRLFDIGATIARLEDVTGPTILTGEDKNNAEKKRVLGQFMQYLTNVSQMHHNIRRISGIFDKLLPRPDEQSPRRATMPPYMSQSILPPSSEAEEGIVAPKPKARKRVEEGVPAPDRAAAVAAVLSAGNVAQRGAAPLAPSRRDTAPPPPAPGGGGSSRGAAPQPPGKQLSTRPTEDKEENTKASSKSGPPPVPERSDMTSPIPSVPARDAGGEDEEVAMGDDYDPSHPLNRNDWLYKGEEPPPPVPRDAGESSGEEEEDGGKGVINADYGDVSYEEFSMPVSAQERGVAPPPAVQSRGPAPAPPVQSRGQAPAPPVQSRGQAPAPPVPKR